MLPTFAAELITFMIARKLLKQKICGHFCKPVVSAKFLSAGCIAAVILIAFITAAIVLVVINRKKNRICTVATLIFVLFDMNNVDPWNDDTFKKL